MDVKWFKIKSWHAIKIVNTFTSRANIDFSIASGYCGRKKEYRSSELDANTATEFDENEKTCESCLRSLSLEGRV
jgi:hypothetical protein